MAHRAPIRRVSSGRAGNSSSRITMCSSIYTGTERQRTVAGHDIHTFNDAY
jgi:hypothetical protein